MSDEIAAAGEVIGILNRIVGWVSHRLGKRIKIREIRRKRDSDIHDTLELYERLFKEEFRVYPAELTAWLRVTNQESKLDAALQHCLLIAKRRGKVVALLKAIYCPESCWAFIAYFGVEKADFVTRKVASKILMKLFSKYVFSRWKHCKGVTFEIESAAATSPKEQKDECRARLRLFRDIARHQGRHAFEVRIDYHQPMMADARAYRGTGRKMALLVVLTKECDTQNCLAEAMKRSDVEQLLQFLYFKIYAGTQEIPNKKREAYMKHLRKIFERASASLTDSVDLES